MMPLNQHDRKLYAVIGILLLVLLSSSLQAQGTNSTCKISLIINGNGQVQVYNLSSSFDTFENASYTFNCGDNVYINAQTPNFAEWTCSGGGCYAGNQPLHHITLNDNITETATFVGSPDTTTTTVLQAGNSTPECTLTGIVHNYGEIEMYNATIPANYTYTNESMQVPCGTTVYIGAVSSYFGNWTCAGHGCYSGTRNFVSFTLNHNSTEFANYAYATNYSTSNSTSTTYNTTSTTSSTTTASQNGGNSSASINSSTNTGSGSGTQSKGSAKNSSLLSNIIVQYAITIVVVVVIVALILLYLKSRVPPS